MSSSAVWTKGNSDSNSSNEFRALALRIVEFAGLAGCSLTPFHQDKLPLFNVLQHEKKREVLNSMKIFIEVCELTLANEKRLDDTKSLIWYGLKHLDMRFTSDIFSSMDDSDIIEVYTNDHVQILRNFKFLSFVSYTVEDIFCRPWTELFIRHDMQKAIATLDVMKKMSTREITETVSLSYLGHHRIEEAISPFKYQYDYLIKFLSPIYDLERCPVGYIMIESASILNPIDNGTERERLLTNYYNSQQASNSWSQA